MKRYTVIAKENNRLTCTMMTIGNDESLLQALWEDFNIRQTDIHFIFKDHPKRLSLAELYNMED